MVRGISYIPELIAKKGWDSMTFAAYCKIYKICGQDTAYRLARGDLDVRLETILPLVKLFGLQSINQVVEACTENGDQ